ncbi:unnamed protein product [Fraxinus pennsylvanica]|uniref:Uncharacterized protein n=1 Tax=Fraxinus pennsylvanica TaxID=56036 RepID=A0AAD2E3Q0_9LAMI|nr:unnamed protein product [Fraxinus pennsylvanica]
MAALAPPDQVADLLQKLTLEPQAKTLEIPKPTKKPSVDSGNGTNGQVHSRDGVLTPIPSDFIDPSTCYLPSTAYYYGGYDGTGSEWKDYAPYVPGGIPASGYQDQIFLFDGSRSPIPWSDGSFMSDGKPRPVNC